MSLIMNRSFTIRLKNNLSIDRNSRIRFGEHLENSDSRNTTTSIQEAGVRNFLSSCEVRAHTCVCHLLLLLTSCELEFQDRSLARSLAHAFFHRVPRSYPAYACWRSVSSSPAVSILINKKIMPSRQDLPHGKALLSMTITLFNAALRYIDGLLLQMILEYLRVTSSVGYVYAKLSL